MTALLALALIVAQPSAEIACSQTRCIAIGPPGPAHRTQPAPPRGIPDFAPIWLTTPWRTGQDAAR